MVDIVGDFLQIVWYLVLSGLVLGVDFVLGGGVETVVGLLEGGVFEVGADDCLE